jgi:cytochrome c oxidase cbb3-type subunit 3
MKTKKHILLLLILSSSGALWAQAAGGATPAPTPATDQFSSIMTWLLVGICATMFVAAMVYVIKTNQFLYKRALELEARLSGVDLPTAAATASTAAAAGSFWTDLRKKYWENPVPIEREGEIILHHDFDGIRELDNVLPPWWVNMFILTIIWAVGYMFYYHWGGNGPSSAEEYKMEVAEAKKVQAVALAGKANAIDEASVTALTDSGALGEGETIFKSTCAACHGQKGEGMVGPNFTDDYWIHGGGIKNIFKTIKYGVPDKGMISWQAQLKPSDIQKVASYILTLHGTNPPNPKAPQGTIWKEEGATAPQDTTQKTDAASAKAPK